MYRKNASARKLILEAHEKAKKSGRFSNASERFCELIGVQPVDERSGADWGNEYEHYQEQD